MPTKRKYRIHEALIADLMKHMPEGVPLLRKKPAWPQTWGELDVNGHVSKWGETGNSYCLQCMFCAHYHPIEGALGADWGLCANVQSEYFRTAVFEHWTCRRFEQGEPKDEPA